MVDEGLPRKAVNVIRTYLTIYDSNGEIVKHEEQHQWQSPGPAENWLSRLFMTNDT